MKVLAARDTVGTVRSIALDTAGIACFTALATSCYTFTAEDTASVPKAASYLFNHTVVA
jgi:hypothetical protein